MLKLILLLSFFSIKALAQPIESTNFNEFKNNKIESKVQLENIKNTSKNLITNQHVRANSIPIRTVSQTVDYNNNAWFNLNSLNSIGWDSHFFCETTFDTSNGSTIGGKLNYLILRTSTNQVPTAKSSFISFTARKTTISAVALQIVSTTGHNNPNIQFRLTGDGSSATFNTKCLPIDIGI